MFVKSDFKEKWDTDIGSLRVHPNKNDTWAMCLGTIIIVTLISVVYVLDGYRPSLTDIVCVSAGALVMLGLAEIFATTKFLLTHDGMYVRRWFVVSFYDWDSFSDIYVENDSARGDVLVICFSRGIARKGANELKASNHPFRFFAFEFKGQKSKTTGKLQIGLPLVEKEEMVSFIKRNRLNVENMELLSNLMPE